MNFPNKFNLTQMQSLFLAKKKWDENVYCGMKMENRAVTFPQTKTILEGVNVPGVKLDDIQAILNMRDAWKYLLNTIDEPLTLGYWYKLNEFIARMKLWNGENYEQEVLGYLVQIICHQFRKRKLWSRNYLQFYRRMLLIRQRL